MKKVKVEVNKFGHSLAEIYQSTNAKMALARKKKDGSYETTHELAKCKDFLHDAMACMFIKGRKSSIYGFNYDPETMPQAETDRMVVYATGIGEKDAENALSIILAIEDANKLDEHTVLLTTEDGGFLFIGPSEWTWSPAAVSMFSGSIRMGQYGNAGGTTQGLRDLFTEMLDMSGNDPEYVAGYGGPKLVDRLGGLLSDASVMWRSPDVNGHGPYKDFNNCRLHHGCGWVSYAGDKMAAATGDGAF